MKLLDSSFCADFLRGRESAKEYRLAHQDASFVLPAVGYYELYHGAVKEGRDPESIDDHLPWIDTLEYERSHAEEGARIRAELEREGRRIQHPDMMLAGVARSLSAPIVSSDRDFEHVDDITVENHRELF